MQSSMVIGKTDAYLEPLKISLPGAAGTKHWVRIVEREARSNQLRSRANRIFARRTYPAALVVGFALTLGCWPTPSLADPTTGAAASSPGIVAPSPVAVLPGWKLPVLGPVGSQWQEGRSGDGERRSWWSRTAASKVRRRKRMSNATLAKTRQFDMGTTALRPA